MVGWDGIPGSVQYGAICKGWCCVESGFYLSERKLVMS